MKVSRWIAVSVAIGLVYYVVERRVLGSQPNRSIATDVWQGTVVGAVLGFISAQILARVWAVKVNGWTTVFGCGLPGNGMLFRAACAQVFPGPVNVPQEAMYWTTSRDGAGHKLDGRRHYVMHFPAGGLPPNDAFWSLTMGDARNRFVANALNRYSVSDRSGSAAGHRDGDLRHQDELLFSAKR